MFPSFRDQIVAVWMVSKFVNPPVGTLEYSRMKVPVSNIGSVILVVFSDSINFFQRLLVFSSCRDWLGVLWLILRCATSGWVFWHLEIWKKNAGPISQYWGASWLYGFCVSLQVGCFGILRFNQMQVPFLSFWWYHLILSHIFQILLIFWQTFNIFKM